MRKLEQVPILIEFYLKQLVYIYMSQSAKGRPSNEKSAVYEHEERKKKPENAKQYWTQHRITLIAYESQYVFAKKPNQFHESRRQQGEPRKKGSRKKVNLQYQSGFLSISPEDSEEIKANELVKNYEWLNSLFNNSQDQNSLEIKEFVRLMLELKHSAIVKQFCEVYNIIVRELEKVQFNQVYKQQARFELLEGIKTKILGYIEKNNDKFPYFVSYLKDDEIETKKLLLVESYCFLAQKFYFNINEFYSEAFSVSIDGNPSKKVKKG